MPAGDGPADEVAGFVPVADLACCPPVEVGLGAGRQAEVAFGQPAEEVHRGRDVRADVEALQVGGAGSAQSLPQPPQVMPDRVPVQDSSLVRVCPGGEGRGGPALQFHEPFVALGQGTGGDQDAAQVVECLARRQLVKDLVGQMAGVPADLGEDLPDLGAVQPGHGHVGPLGPGESLVKRGEVGADPGGLVTDEAAYPLVQGAALAGTRAEQPGRLADGAAIPEARVGVEALRAQRRVAGAAPHRRNDQAVAAPGPPGLTPVAPRLAGGPGDLTLHRPVADSAGQHGPVTAVLA